MRWEDPPQTSVWRQRKRAALLAHVQVRLAFGPVKADRPAAYGQFSGIVWSCIMASAWDLWADVQPRAMAGLAGGSGRNQGL